MLWMLKSILKKMSENYMYLFNMRPPLGTIYIIQYIIKYHTSTGINCTVWELQIDWYISAKYVWRILYYYTSPGLGISSSVFRANRSYFAQKWANEQFPQKNERFTHSLIFSEQPEQFAHDRSFPLSDLSE